MRKVYFVRHAEPNYENHDDCSRELSSKGLEDRKLVTRFLSDKCIDIALSSPYKRAIDTIKDFTDIVGLQIEVVDGFRERKVDSVWIEDFDTFTMHQWKDFTYKLSDGECLQAVQQRNIEALNSALEKYKGKNIIVGSHGTALSTVIIYFDQSFAYAGFKRIKSKMPWIVEFSFDDNKKLIHMKEHDLF